MDKFLSKMKILFVIDALQFGGGERVFSQLIKGLPYDKYLIFLASSPNKEFYQSLNGGLFSSIFLNFSSRANLSLIFALRRIIHGNRIDIVHGQGARAEFYARVAKSYSANAKYVSTLAMPVEGFDIGRLRKKIYRFFDRITERYVDHFIVVSDALKNFLVNQRGIPNDKITRIYNGIELDRYQPELKENAFRKQMGIGNETPVIGAIGRLVWQKGFEYLIKAAPEVIRSVPKAMFLIVGDGPLRDSLDNLTKKLKIESNIKFIGFQKNIKNILSAIDVLAVPSVLEGFPMITLEAMAMGKPIIATRIDGITEQSVHGQSAILIPPGDITSLSKSIIKVLKDKNLQTHLVSNARKRVEEHFSVQNMLEQTQHVYQSILYSN